MTSPVPATSPGPALTAPRDDLCLDFANTRYWRGTDPATETLAGPDDLLDWAEAATGTDARMTAALRQRWRDDPDTADRAFRAAIELREAIYAVFVAVAADGDPAPERLATLNAALSEAPARTHLERVDGRFVWRITAAPAIKALLAPVLWSAGDLLTGGRLERVKCCANDRCGWLFLDDSKSANRRWCSMSACGNRAKAHRHYTRRRQA